MERMCVYALFHVLRWHWSDDRDQANEAHAGLEPVLRRQSSGWGNAQRSIWPYLRHRTWYTLQNKVQCPNYHPFDVNKFVILLTERNVPKWAYMPLSSQAYMDRHSLGHILFVYPEGMKTIRTKETSCASSCCISDHYLRFFFQHLHRHRGSEKLVPSESAKVTR